MYIFSKLKRYWIYWLVKNLHKHGTEEFLNICRTYSNTPAFHKKLITDFYIKTNTIDYLKRHRDFIEKFNYGYGDRYFHYLWKLLIEQFSSDFIFLEIGVYKGQVISLIQLISQEIGKNPRIVGITPLSSAGDKYSNHPDLNYLRSIKNIYKKFNLNFSHTKIIKGYSQDLQIIKKASLLSPFDLIYIDGCHDYEVVMSDITNYSLLIRKGGFLVIDDASRNLHMPKKVSLKSYQKGTSTDLFTGFEDVAKAVSDSVDNNKSFVHLFACGHNRVWMKV